MLHFFVFLFDLVLKMNMLERMGMSGMINHKESSYVLTPRHETDVCMLGYFKVSCGTCTEQQTEQKFREV